MNSFVECSIAMQNFLMILLEICLILELILFLLRITCFSGKKKVITAITVFAVSVFIFHISSLLRIFLPVLPSFRFVLFPGIHDDTPRFA